MSDPGAAYDSEALASGARGQGRLVILEGPPGVGKTRLLEAARESARAAGMRALSARGTGLERGIGPPREVLFLA